MADVVEPLLGQQLRDAIDEESYMDFEDSIFKYIQVKATDLLPHILDNYAIVDNQVIKANRLAFDEAPDFALPIDVYFRKQERCKLFSIDGGVPILAADMVIKLQLHMGKLRLVSSNYTKWCAKPAEDRTWMNGKIHFRKALCNAAKINNLMAA